MAINTTATSNTQAKRKADAYQNLYLTVKDEEGNETKVKAGSIYLYTDSDVGKFIIDNKDDITIEDFSFDIVMAKQGNRVFSLKR